ncbi:MAG TPA: cytochrome C oxidase subunit IV family protein [Fimbriiglobus sp.]|nr:cytochrome C oxidase subunit IV family protein [Fimbriiglobus sp.]
MSEPRETVFEHDEHTIPPTANTLTVFAVLAGLSLLQMVIGFSDLGPWKVLATLLVIGVQATVLAYFFMDLRQADSLTWLCVGGAMFWTFLLFLFTLTDYLTRYLAAL